MAKQSETPQRPRRWLAVILSGLVPGLGHWYRAEPKRAIGWLALVALIPLFAVQFRWFSSFESTLGVMFVLCIALLICTLDAARSLNPQGAFTAWYRSFGGYLGFVCMALILQSIVQQVVSEHYRVYRIPSESMLPTLMPGDYIIVELKQKNVSALSSTDVVVLPKPDAVNDDVIKKETEFEDVVVKRIIGLPGEDIELTRQQLKRNGQPVVESYAQYKEGGVADFSAQKVPADTVLLLGDNRDYSRDARFWKETFISKEKIIGIVRYVMFSDEKPERVGIAVSP